MSFIRTPVSRSSIIGCPPDRRNPAVNKPASNPAAHRAGQGW